MAEQVSFTGRARRRTTRPAVKLADRTARLLITVGGAGTIVAVIGVFLFLVWVAAPLFIPAEAGVAGRHAAPFDARAPLQVGVDEYRVLGWAALPDGSVQAFRLDDGSPRGAAFPFNGQAPSSASFSAGGGDAIFGFPDGTVRLVRIGFATSFLADEEVPQKTREALREAGPGAVSNLEDGIVGFTPEGQLRCQILKVEARPPVSAAAGPILRVGLAETTTGPLVVVLAQEESGPVLRVLEGGEQEDFLTGETTFVLEPAGDLPFEPLSPGLPDHLLVSGSGAAVYVAWGDGALLRIDRTRPQEPFIAESGWLTSPGVALTSLRPLLGATTLAWGDAAGNLRAGFLVRDPGPGFPGLRDARRDPARSGDALAVVKSLEEGGVAVRSLAASSRSRLLLAGFDDGALRLYNVTRAARLTGAELGAAGPVTEIAFAPKEDGFLAVTPEGVVHGSLDPGYPETGLGALFRPVWYEGYPRPEHVWQSTGGTDDFEPKLGLMPLVFGTLKATFYSILFGAPIALLAAVFTSEFLHRRTRSVVKPVIELMASLPSVVLGFLAALVIAPFVEGVVASVLAGALTLPGIFLLGAYLWQLLPGTMAIRLARWRFPLFLGVVAPAGLVLAGLLGPGLERALFAGDIRGWLAWDPANPTLDAIQFESPVGGWLLLWLPVSGLLAALGIQRLVNPPLLRWGRGRSRATLATLDLVKFAVGAAAAVAAALAVALLLDGLGLDPRGGFVGTYVQRNAMVVGFVMGFAIIPIIYTIAEDALSTVPEHLRSASLGAGATQWQTAVRIIVPTAMSGLFSALMIGLGRAVGETMIVLMAAGNTPVMDWNIFSGFRTLSANIAVELPEAVRGSTHYRTLFLAALVLFAMTFVVNTAAEVVRLRFRKRAYQL